MNRRIPADTNNQTYEREPNSIKFALIEVHQLPEESLKEL